MLIKTHLENEVVHKIEQLNSLSYSDPEAESNLLSCLIVNSSLMLDTIMELTSGDFTTFEHGEIFTILKTMYENDESFDPITIIQKIEQLDNNEEVKLHFFNVIRQPILFFNFKQYLKRIIICSVKKKIHRLSQDMLKVTTTDQDPTQIIDSATNLLISLLSNITENKDREIVDLNAHPVTLLRSIFSLKQNGLTTGFPTLDEIMYGFLPSEVTVLAARPSVGKTALSLYMGLSAARKDNIHVLFFSLEMSTHKIVERILSQVCHASIIELKKIYNLDNEQEYLSRLAETNMTIIHTPSLSIDVIKNLTRANKLKNPNIGLIIIDYIQLIEIKGRFENRQYEMAKITREIKNLASELHISVLVLSQVTRDVDQFSKPKLSHLKSSGTIEEHFDNIILMHNDSHVPQKQFEDKQNNQTGKIKNIELLLAKHRNGPIGSLRIKFFPDLNMFSE